MSEYLSDNQRRKEALKGLILDLHQGGDMEEIKAQFGRLISDVSAIEIARLEQELIEEGLPAEEIKALCDVHVSVFQAALDGETLPEMTPGHPVHTFKSENFAAGELLKLLEEAVAQLDGEESERALTRARSFANQLADVNTIYLRKENLLFPILETHGVTGPSSVMWAIHDDIRRQGKVLREALEAGEIEKARETLEPLATAIKQMFYKEEHILYPTSLKMLTDEEWLIIRDGSDDVGYCLIRPGDLWHPEAEKRLAETALSETTLVEGQLALDTGKLSPELVNLLLTHLPIDVTYVDENDTVRYYSQGPERIFTRTPAIIGRQVRNCHPPASVHVVERLLDDFRTGARDSAEFWIQMAGKFIHIRYFAVRDADGEYRGTIEVTQDITAIRALDGERRLLDDA